MINTLEFGRIYVMCRLFPILFEPRGASIQSIEIMIYYDIYMIDRYEVSSIHCVCTVRYEYFEY